jgi:membrane fusion protein, multidrug efflux system
MVVGYGIFMSSKSLYTAVAVVGIAVVGFGGWWLQSRPTAPQSTQPGNAAQAQTAGAAASAPRPAGVEVVRPELLTLQDDAQAVGSLRARQSVMLRPEVAGRVVKLGFADGARVRLGQVLVQLDDTLQKAELQQALAQQSIAGSNYKRNQELVAQSFVAQRVLDESSANLEVASAQVALAQARLARMSIKAPFDGTVGLGAVNTGDYVKDGADLVNLQDTRSMQVDFSLPERYQSRLALGQPVQLLLDALPGRTVTAKIEALDPLLDANGRAVAVRARVDNTADNALRPGMFARANVVFDVREKALLLPEEAIVPQGGKQYVYKVVSPSALPASAAAGLPADIKSVSQRQEVKLGLRRAGKVEITAGLQAADTVVVAGQQRLQRDGSPVRVVSLERPGAAAAIRSASAVPAVLSVPGNAAGTATAAGPAPAAALPR